MQEDIYTRLEEAMTEAEKFNQEPFEESTHSCKSELGLAQDKKQAS
jgi:hypothetical protein